MIVSEEPSDHQSMEEEEREKGGPGGPKAGRERSTTAVERG